MSGSAGSSQDEWCDDVDDDVEFHDAMRERELRAMERLHKNV